MEQATSKVQNLIDENKVVLFTKSWCPYCKESIQTLNRLAAEYTVCELDKLPDGGDMQNALAELTGQRTVPNNFINKKHIGGNSDLQDLARKGKLEDLLREAGALKA